MVFVWWELGLWLDEESLGKDVDGGRVQMGGNFEVLLVMVLQLFF